MHENHGKVEECIEDNMTAHDCHNFKVYVVLVTSQKFGNYSNLTLNLHKL